MRLSERRKKQREIRGKQRHKSLDAICETEYTQNRVKIESPRLSEVNGDVSEVRRSSRVRRAPLVLDASPPPPKKRRKIREQVGGVSAKRIGDRDPALGLEEEESGEWKSRLRARGKKVSFVTENSSPRSKRKLFDHSNGVRERLDSRLDEKKEALVGKTLMVVQSKRPGRLKASSVASNGDISLDNSGEDSEDTADQQVVNDNNKGILLKDGVTNNGAVDELVEQGKEGISNSGTSEDIAKNIVESVEQSRPAEQAESRGKESHSSHQDVTHSDHVRDHTSNANHIQDENSKKVGEDKYSLPHRQYKPRIKKGRWCGLCGGGIDGKPPKKLVHNGAGSDNEACSGSSSAEEPTYDKWDGFGDEPGWLGPLLGPINDRFGIAGIWVHQHCAVWSPEVYFAGLGCLKNVRSALFRGKVLKCSRCGRRGATIGCRVDRCPKTYHLPCARVIGCIFDHRKFLIACTDHRHLFQPHGIEYLERLKKIKAKKMKLELRKQSNDAWRKDHEAEEKWLENCGEDEEFLKRESKRLHRDLSRISPVYIGGPSLDNQMPFQGWESVGGLQDVIHSLKEVVILPLLYPEFFNNIGLTPPRGVLLHGCPGTGKTLVVRSLIGSCARGDKRIAYFARKGADCLGKYVGDAERQLRLLFQVAEKSQPSIIFFDEIDGLAPSRTRQQDQTHNSVVSTLLALLDGLKSRGSVIVIGATNRPDAIDPALRRPGRFDREIYFPLPSVKDREAILSLHTQKWPTPMNGSLLKLIARRTVGFAGADLQALCTQTAINALKRRCNWEKLLKSAEEKGCVGKRPVLPTFVVQERDWLEALSSAPPPCSRREAGMAANDIVSAPLPVHLFPCMLQSLSKLLVSLYLDDRVSLPSSLSKAAATIKAVVVSALDGKKENSNCWWSRVQDIVKEAEVASDVESNLLRANVLAGYGTFFGSDAFNDRTDDPKVHNGFLQKKLVYGASHSLGKKPGFCLLISGSPRSGQRHLASCILHSFVENAVLHKIDLATILHEGAGDMVQGLTQILVRCAGVGSCMLFMPRIDLWALEKSHQVTDEENESCLKSQVLILRASDLWSSFVEQAESIFISASLTILATAEVAFELLPPRIKEFFGGNKQNLSPSNHTGSSIPRFSVHADGKFNRDMVIGSSATKLSNDVARYFVELIHHKTHVHENLSKANESFDMDALHSNPDSDSAVDYRSKSQTSFLLNKKEGKGKSNLLLAISTFGYQLLQYPHFAELCWVTSKLKEGPSAEIDRPWKVWPFNSCIVRPMNVKSKEKYGLVHGLVAVGLSAFRGLYSSLREVTADVRNVLEILTSQINAKVEGGKDKYQFVRLLSQVAYLDDVVNNWAYTLQSLEAITKLDENARVQGDDCMDKPSHSESVKEITERLENDQHRGHAASIADESNRLLQTQWSSFFNNQTDNPLENEPNGVVLERSELKSNQLFLTQGSSSFKDQTDNPLENEPNGTFLERSELKSNRMLQTQGSSSFRDPTDNPLENKSIGTVLERSEVKSNQMLPTQGSCFFKDQTDASRENEPNGVVLERSELKTMEQSNGFVCEESVSADQVSRSSPSCVSLYRFCSKCLFNLKSAMQRIIISHWDTKSSSLTTEDVDDDVTSLSLNLYATVREFCLSGSQDNVTTFIEGRSCGCEVSGDKRLECVCHSESSSSSNTTGHGVISELIYKNGVAAAVLDNPETETDVHFDCKFQTLCLCSLIEYIVMTKQPSG